MPCSVQAKRGRGEKKEGRSGVKTVKIEKVLDLRVAMACYSAFASEKNKGILDGGPVKIETKRHSATLPAFPP